MKAPEANILLVEDDQVNQFVTTRLLQKWGMRVVIANNGAEALAQIASKIFQVVLMDIQMPVMNGLESTTRIREMDDLYFKTVPIIAFTASGMLDAKEMVVQSGMNDIITKPLVAEEMQIKISKYIHTLCRPLFVNFDLYTQGDADYKKELISLLIGNLDELQRALSNVGSQDGLKVLTHVFHKIKVAVSILNDPELTRVLEEVKLNCVGTDAVQFIQHKLKYLSALCGYIKESLLRIDCDLRRKPLLGGSLQSYTIPPAA